MNQNREDIFINVGIGYASFFAKEKTHDCESPSLGKISSNPSSTVIFSPI